VIETTSLIGRRREERKMAQIDKANMNGRIETHANISDTVGKHGKNERTDVMLIQAMFKLVGMQDEAQFFGGNDGSWQLPRTTGVCDYSTLRAIWAFQTRNSFNLLSADGTVHPANYRHRVIKPGRRMTITLLNALASEGGLLAFGLDLITSLKAMAPQLILKPSDI